jgi:hypothetical protein
MRLKIASTLILAAVILAACNVPAPTQSIDAIASQVASTLAAMASATSQAAPATETQPAATATQPLPTATNPPAATNTPETGRIVLLTGATQGVVTGHVNANQTLTFTARAAQNQILIAMLSTPSGNAVMEIVGADGNELLDGSKGWTSFRTLLPKTQDYSFRVIGGNSGQDFTLSVNFAVPVQFASGADSATYEGQTAGGYAVTYTVYAQKNQDLHVKVNTDPDDAALTIWGFNDGNPYARAQNGVTDFSLDLPRTQYYIIEVVPQGGRVINYELEIEVD